MRTKQSTRKQLRGLRRQRLALALVGAMVLPSVPALAQSLPSGADIVSGTIDFDGSTGTEMVINQDSRGAIIDWTNFSIGSGYGVTFNQPTDGVTLNRVISMMGPGYSPAMSQIDGNLSANGSVFIINPAGITFGADAVVNVGGLVASTLWISEEDFNAGLDGGSYRFDGFNDDPGSTHQVRNNGSIEAGSGGVAFVGTTLRNHGAITTDGGNIGFGAGSQVTLDFVGDGLTQVTIDVPPSIDSGIMQGDGASMTADGMQILLRTAATAQGTGGGIQAGGTLRARTLANVAGRVELTSDGGLVMLGALGVVSDASSPFTAGLIDVGGGAGNGGSVLLRGNQVALVNDDSEPDHPVDPASTGSRIDASGGLAGGTVDLQATDALTLMSLSGISADGGMDGGGVSLSGNTVSLGMGTTVSANGAGGAGGGIAVAAGESLMAYGLLSAHGATSGGSVGTSVLGDFDIRGLRVDAGADGAGAGTWTLTAADIDVVHGDDVGPVDDIVVLGTSVQDADISAALDGGSNVTLRAVGGSNSNVSFGEGVDIAYTSAAGPLTLQVDADDGIFGSNFSIAATGAALTMAFNADASNLTYGFSGIGFSDATLASNGGNILFYGQSDQANGVASSYATGLSLNGSTLTTSGGDVLLRGATTGADAGGDDAGVSVYQSSIDAGTGTVTISGTGEYYTNGVIVQYGDITADRIEISGTGAADGINALFNDIDAGAGGILLEGTGGDAGVRFNGGLHSAGGDIVVHGSGTDGDGVFVYGSIYSEGGAIELVGDSGEFRGVAVQFGYDGSIASGGGDIDIAGDGSTIGVALIGNGYGTSEMDSDGGAIAIVGTATGDSAYGVSVTSLSILGDDGDVSLTGSVPGGIGVRIAGSGSIATTSGDILLDGTGGDAGVRLYGSLYGEDGGIVVRGNGTGAEGDGVAIYGRVATGSGDILLEGTGEITGVRLYGDLYAEGGDIAVHGSGVIGDGIAMYGGISSAGGAVALVGDSEQGRGVAVSVGYADYAVGIDSAGGDIDITGDGATFGVVLVGSAYGTGSMDIEGMLTIVGTATGVGAVGVYVDGVAVDGGASDISLFGSAVDGTGVLFGGASGITTTTGAIAVTGIGLDAGLQLQEGNIATDSGHIDLRGRGTAATADGLVIGEGVVLASDGGIELSGEGGSGAGVVIGAGAQLDAGAGTLVLRAGNDGSSDAVRLLGTLHSDTGINLRPGGVALDGSVGGHLDDAILLGDGNGFALDDAELALIDAPQLVIGSSEHAGAIQVVSAIARDGNLTLQNDGGAGGIAVQAALDVGDGTLALSSGGSITQTAAGAITAHSLLARADTDVLLATAENNVASTTLAGSAGGAFEFLDADGLAVGTVTASVFDATTGQFASASNAGIGASGDVLVRNLQGDLVLGADIAGADIDLVTAGTLQNPGGASLAASGNWRVWANTWDGEQRGGLAGGGDLPNLYGCAFLGPCGVTVSATDSHFIYVQQPTAVITVDDATREYGLANPLLTWQASGAILGDGAAAVAAGALSTDAAIGSDVGAYAIDGGLVSAAGYNLVYVPGTLTVTPATLVFTADQLVRFLGAPNPELTGTVTGFRNGDTVESVFGSTPLWTTTAGELSPIGSYAVNGGASTLNYVFVQAPGNATALQVLPLSLPPEAPTEYVREQVNTYVYDRNIGAAPVCALNASLDDQPLASTGDALSMEWAKVRSRPNLTNCFDSQRSTGCGDF